jgi:hypothetical protein
MNLGRDPASMVQEEEVVEKKQRDHLKESRQSHVCIFTLDHHTYFLLFGIDNI